MAKVLIVFVFVSVLLSNIGCGPSTPAPQTEPPAPEVKQDEPARIEELRKQVPKDPEMFKAEKVIKEYGKLKKNHISYEKYKELMSNGGAMDPDWFYDSYQLDMNEKNHWITLIFGTSKRSKSRDPQISKVMTGLPENSISVKLKTPQGRNYILSDSDADGVLDYAANANQKTTKIDVKVLDAMQEKYTWILGIIKTYYKKLK